MGKGQNPLAWYWWRYHTASPSPRNSLLALTDLSGTLSIEGRLLRSCGQGPERWNWDYFCLVWVKMSTLTLTKWEAGPPPPALHLAHGKL